MNYIILIITCKVAKAKAKRWRLVVGACTGGVYAVLLFIPELSVCYTLFGKLVFSLLLTWLVFGVRSIREYFKNVMVFYFTAFAIAGAIYGIISLIGTERTRFPWKILAFSTSLSYVCIILITRSHRKKVAIEKNVGELKITLKDKETTMSCLVDTGNESGLTITEFSSVKPLFPAEFSKEFQSIDSDDYVSIAEFLDKWKSRVKLRVYPFNSLGKSGGVLLGFDADEVSFDGNNVKTAVGLTKSKLTPTDMYQAILGGKR